MSRLYAVYPTAAPTEITFLNDLVEAKRALDSYSNVGVEARFVRISPEAATGFITLGHTDRTP